MAIHRISARAPQTQEDGSQQEGDNLNKMATYYSMRIIDGEEVKLAAVGSQATYKAILIACKIREIFVAKGQDILISPSYTFQDANEEAISRGVSKVRSIELNLICSS